MTPTDMPDLFPASYRIPGDATHYRTIREALDNAYTLSEMSGRAIVVTDTEGRTVARVEALDATMTLIQAVKLVAASVNRKRAF